jgi:RNA polymerase sigma-70 factor, ECF subfamily
MREVRPPRGPVRTDTGKPTGPECNPAASPPSAVASSDVADRGAQEDPFVAERALVEALQAGHHAAFRVAVARYSPQMLARARSIVGPANAEDVVQETWLAAFRQIGNFEHRAALGTWLQSIVSNTAISLLRKRAREVSPPSYNDEEPEADWFDASGSWATPPSAWAVSSPEDLLMADALQDCIDKHLLLMSDTQREVLIKRDIQGEEFETICNDMTLSASNVRVLLHRARMRIMRMIEHFQETGSC